MGFGSQGSWALDIGSVVVAPGDLPRPGIEPVALTQAGGFFTTEPPWEP